MKTIYNLTNEEQEKFAEFFYDDNRVNFDDCIDGVSTPFGCPWYHGSHYDTKAKTVKGLVDSFIKENLKEIQTLNKLDY